MFSHFGRMRGLGVAKETFMVVPTLAGSTTISAIIAEKEIKAVIKKQLSTAQVHNNRCSTYLARLSFQNYLKVKGIIQRDLIVVKSGINPEAFI
jgi:hypothetical protein